MDALVATIAEQKAELDALRPLTRAALLAVQKHFDVELTYTSNAIEGNPLSGSTMRSSVRSTADMLSESLSVDGHDAVTSD